MEGIYDEFVSKLKKYRNLNNEYYHPRFIMMRNDNLKIPFDKNVTSLIYVNSFDYDRTLENPLDPRPDYLPKDKYYVLSNKKICNDLNWKPKTSFDELIKMMVLNDYNKLK